MTLREPLVFRYPEGLIFWAVFIWAFFPEIRVTWRAIKARRGAQDAGTVRLILVASQIGMFAAFALSPLVCLALPSPRTAFYTGIGLLLAGSLLRRYCFRILGKYFTGAVMVSADQPVINRGPYRWVRHPSYTGGMLMYLGIGVALGSGLSLAIVVSGPLYAYSRRVKVEENAMLETIGEPYRAYMARTKRFIPFLW